MAQTTDERLQPLRPWAALRAQQTTAGRSTTVLFDVTALDAMAAVCGLDRAELVRALATDGPTPETPPTRRDKNGD